MNVITLSPSPIVGKTQAMLDEALEGLRERSVAIVARDRAHARELFARLKNMGLHGDREELVLRGFGHWLYIVLPSTVSSATRGRSSMQILVDHSVIL
jgi:hypothetical protein